ncbi:substrate-binding domain-containing protein [bacterium]|nr:substrate-binding domain-containing protein [bacterium]
MTTLQKIAERAGVSIGTVDRVLHNRGRVAPATEARVRKAIDELDYTPNLYARNLKLGKVYTIGIVMPGLDQDGGYWALSAAGMNRALRELAVNRIRGRFFNYDRYAPDSMFEVEQDIRNTDLDGLLIAPVLTDSVTELIRRLPENTPYIFFDSDLPKLNPVSVINQDGFQSGRLAAELMVKILSPPGTLLVIKTLPDDYHISARCNGFMNYFGDSKKYTVEMEEADIGEKPGKLKPLLETAMNGHSGLKGIFITNALTYQVAKALKKLSNESRPALIGYDLIEDNAVCLDHGLIDFIISQRPEMQGYQGIYMMFRHLIIRETVERRIEIPLDIITRENMNTHRI